MAEPIAFRTGSSVAQINEHNDSLQQATIPQPEPEKIVPLTPAEPIVPEAVVEPAAEKVPEPEKNVSVVNFDAFQEQTGQVAGGAVEVQPTTATNWKDEFAKDPDAFLKQTGLSDFAIEMDRHIKNGGDPADYLNAKAIDFNKITDDALLKDDIRKQYPTLSPAQIDLMFSRKYSVSEEASDEDKEFLLAQKQADAYNVRQRAITEQQKFKIPTTIPVDNTAHEQEKLAEQNRQIEASRKWWNEHEATKALMTSKRVALNLGENGTFNFDVSQPEFVTKAITDSGIWQKLTATKQGEPDVVKLQKLVLYASNTEKFENDLVNYGKTLALPSLLQEGQNIVIPGKVMPMTAENKGKVEWTSAKTGKVGG